MPRPSPRHYDLEHLFSRPRPKDQHLPRYEAIKAAATVFAEILLENVPPGLDQDDAIRHVRKAVLLANSAISLEGAVLKSETVVKQLLDKVLAHRAHVEEIHMCTEDASKLHGHFMFERETDHDRLVRGVVGRVGGASIVVSTDVTEGSVKVVEQQGQEPSQVMLSA